MIYTIDEIRTKIRPICTAHKIQKLWLFGSYARGEAREDSDVDFHIKVNEGTTLFQLGGIYADLEEAMGKEIDIITRIPEELEIFKKYVERDEILLYDSQQEGRANPQDYRKAL